MSPRIHAVTGALLLALAVPAGAQAVPTIEPLKPCYVTAGTAANSQGEAVAINAQGFTPNAKVDLTLDGAAPPGGVGLQVGATGLLQVPPFPAPFVRRGIEETTLALAEQGNPVNAVSTVVRAVALNVSVRPREARPSQTIRFKGAGFTADKPVYAHYVRGGKQRERVRMVRRTGDCGKWSVRRPQFPMNDPDQGTWFVQFDQSKRYVNGLSGKLKTVFVRLKITIRLVSGD